MTFKRQIQALLLVFVFSVLPTRLSATDYAFDDLFAPIKNEDLTRNEQMFLGSLEALFGGYQVVKTLSKSPKWQPRNRRF